MKKKSKIPRVKIPKARVPKLPKIPKIDFEIGKYSGSVSCTKTKCKVKANKKKEFMGLF